MLKIEFETPPLGELLTTPALQRDAMVHSRPFVAKPEHQQGLGFPGELVDDWQDVALAKMGELLGKYRSLHQRALKRLDDHGAGLFCPKRYHFGRKAHNWYF